MPGARRHAVLLVIAACGSPEPPPPPEPAPRPSCLEPLSAPTVRQELSSPWCDQGDRTGRLLWDPVPGAVRYQVALVDATACCDFEYAKWPDRAWLAGVQRSVEETATPTEKITSIYYRVRAVARDGCPGTPAFGMWECWWE